MGTDRHEMEPKTGYAVTLEGMKKDIAIFHDLNINAVRTSHYPNDPTWYELCDREGIYVCPRRQRLLRQGRSPAEESALP